jgi:hypothetical protein
MTDKNLKNLYQHSCFFCEVTYACYALVHVEQECDALNSSYDVCYFLITVFITEGLIVSSCSTDFMPLIRTTIPALPQIYPVLDPKISVQTVFFFFCIFRNV